MKKKTFTTRKMVIAALLGAVCMVMGLTGLGMIPMPTPSGRATIMHVPVILAGILEGPVVGGLAGLIFGVYSFFTPSGVIPQDPIVRILPRIAIGIASAYAFKMAGRKISFGAFLAGIVGTTVNTVGFVGLAVIMGYLPQSAALLLIPQFLGELVAATVIVVILTKALYKRLH